MSTYNEFDITIIGGGPAGLFSAFYAGMRSMSVKIIDSLGQLGGQVAELYPDKYIYDIGGFSRVLGKEFIQNLIDQAQYASPEICLNETVLEVQKQEDGSFRLTTNKGEHFTKSILITGGIGAFEPRRLTALGADFYEGKNLHYSVKNLHDFRDSKVLVCGGGDSALDWSLMLDEIAEKVTLCHRREGFKAHESSIGNLYKSGVEVKIPYVVKELAGDSERIEKVVLADKDGNEEIIEVDHVIVNYGSISSLGLIKSWGLEMEKNSIIVNSKMETNIKGIYAAGDIATYEGKVKLIAVGLGEAPIAINNAKKYVDPSSRVQPLHSTSVFKLEDKQMKLVGVSGSLIGSKTSKAVHEVLWAAKSIDSSIDIELVDLKDYEVEFVKGTPLSYYNEDTVKVVNTVLSADFLVIGTPIYQASIPGALKNLFDHLPMEAFKSKVTGMVTTGGTDKHYLVMEYQLKPILTYLKGVVPLGNVFVHNSDFDEHSEIVTADVNSRIKQLAEEMIFLQKTLSNRG
ncbi:hypothetical protein CVD23_00905 [Bacillus sp. V33-4]|nr:hypothetical protein CVD23_00905 [Bacillus sp. V33-4]